MVKNSDYRKIGLVGQGQFGKVYGGIHRHTGELVALKELNAENISTRQFLSEIHILFTLQHPHVVSCFGVEHQEQKRYLISEYCNAGTLRTLIDSSYDLSLEQKLKLIIDILDGLDYIHSKNIIHRDLKPDNILLSLTHKGWTAKISDFGIAKIHDQETDPTSVNIGYTGSPAYMAPEQFYGKCSRASDIYAIGIIFWELLTNDRPFLGTPAEIMKGHLNEILEIPEQIPESLQEIILQALEKLPQNRFATASQMRSAILEATLSLSTYTDGLYAQIPQEELDYELIDEREIKDDICFLDMNHYCIYQSTKNNLIIDHYYIDPKTSTINSKRHGIYGFNSQVLDLHRADRYGCMLTTNSFREKTQYFLLHFQDQFEEKFNWFSNHLAYAYSNNWKWFVCNQIMKLDEGFTLTDLSSSPAQIKTFIRDFLPEQIINIDYHHGVAIYQQPQLNPNHTYFRFFNRRGNWYDTYIIPTNMNKVIVHEHHKNIFLTREKNTNNLLLINFYPYFVRRFPLSFRADFYIATKGGFICASDEGNIAFLGLSGQYLGEINLRGNIIAIASYTLEQFIVILKQQDQQSRLFFQVNISNELEFAEKIQ